jgi:hypothetical protein
MSLEEHSLQHWTGKILYPRDSVLGELPHEVTCGRPFQLS